MHTVDPSTPAQRPTAPKTQITLSMESNPLYSSQSVAGSAIFTENQSLLGILQMPPAPRSKSLEPEAEESVNKTIQYSHSAMGLDKNQNASSGNAIVQDMSPGNTIVSSRNPVAQDVPGAPLANGTVSINVYGSYRDSVSFPDTASNNGGGMPGEKEATFDDPDYDDVQY